MKIIFIVLTMVCLVSCTKHIYYLKPEVRGQLYNAETKEPIANTAGYLQLFLQGERAKKIKTDATGAFKVPAYSHDYYFKQNPRNFIGPPTLYIAFSYYESERYDYSKGKVVSNVKGDSGIAKFRIIDVGKVYLKPKPEFKLSDEDN